MMELSVNPVNLLAYGGILSDAAETFLTITGKNLPIGLHLHYHLTQILIEWCRTRDNGCN